MADAHNVDKRSPRKPAGNCTGRLIPQKATVAVPRPPKRAFEMLEPCAVKTASTVLRGGRWQQCHPLTRYVYKKNPSHPGAAHYVIHAYDDPEHAEMALDAAQRYAEIAPEAPHALHSLRTSFCNSACGRKPPHRTRRLGRRRKNG